MRFRVGLATTHDLLQFQEEEVSAEGNQVQAEVDLENAKLALAHSDGTLLQQFQYQLGSAEPARSAVVRGLLAAEITGKNAAPGRFAIRRRSFMRWQRFSMMAAASAVATFPATTMGTFAASVATTAACMEAAATLMSDDCATAPVVELGVVAATAPNGLPTDGEPRKPDYSPPHPPYEYGA